MIPDDYRPLFDRLYKRTVAGEVNWKQTADERTLAIHVGKFTLTMFQGVDRQTHSDFVRWELLDDSGTAIDSFYIGEEDEDWEGARDLFDRARRIAIRLDEALDTIMKELEEGESVGGDPPTPKFGGPQTDVEDDLPF